MATHNASQLAIVQEPLSETNYGTWKIWMSDYLMSHDLWDIVDGTEVKPDETQSKFKTWRKTNAKALHTIQISCGPNAASSILGIDSAKAVWDHLVSIQLETSVIPPLLEQSVTVNVDYAWAILLNWAMKKGDLVTTKMILDGQRSAVRMGITSSGETTLFKTALSGNLPFVKELVHIRDNQELPLVVAATNGNKDMVHYIYDKTSKEDLKPKTSKNGIDFVIVSIVTNVYDLSLDKLNKYEKLAVIPDKFGVIAMCMLAGKTSMFISGSQNGIFQQCWYLLIIIPPPPACLRICMRIINSQWPS
ncbi:hypothetical protein GIB67_040196 [Kingdonia uniflora]|uniref:DUF4219 domain-containing protein n=1 Tax=Kingdonia uniflora TaxID=39325 RepID=A0A7J7MV60_9MAGN|nr:hypothetical protein GIB67_040196 [Kingdonia uniflora]